MVRWMCEGQSAEWGTERQSVEWGTEGENGDRIDVSIKRCEAEPVGMAATYVAERLWALDEEMYYV